jgi:osmotically-inducible protein OsmY
MLLSAVSHRPVKLRGALVLGAIIVLAAGLGQTSTGHAVLQKAGLFEKPASYTALSFKNPQSLPRQLDSQRTDVRISFEIQNTSSVPQDYQWTVQLDQGALTYRAATGNAHLGSARAVVIARDVQISCTQGLVRMIVSLARPAEFIDSWAACSPPGTKRP